VELFSINHDRHLIAKRQIWLFGGRCAGILN
jgi:hypothetical protein